MRDTLEFTLDVGLLAFLLGEIRDTNLRPSTSVENLLQISPFMQNKPKLKDTQMNVSSFITSKYAKVDNWLNQTNKPNSKPIQTQTNPIAERPKMNVNLFTTKDYEEKCGLRLWKNKPNTNPTGAKRKS